jgi:energy-coupling factor transporter ATP-binding protein EcfA2
MKAKIAQKHQNIILITGRTGTGKSELAWQIGKFLDPNGFSLDNIFWDTDSLIKVAASKEDIKPPGTVFIFDEAREGTQSLNAMSETNRRMGLFLDTVRSRGYHILLLQPDYFFFQLSIAIMASDLLIHVEKEGNEEFHQQLIEGKRYGEIGNEITASPFIRGNGRIYNFDQKKKLYIKGKKMRDMDINRDYSVFSFSKSSGIVDQEEYDRRKNEAVAKMNDAFEKETEPKLNPRAEKVLHFKQKAFYLLHSHYGMTPTKIAKYFEVTLPEVSRLINDERRLLETDFNVKPIPIREEAVHESDALPKEEYDDMPF